MTPSLFAKLKKSEEEVEDIILLLVVLSKETPLLSALGLKFGLKSKTNTKQPVPEFEVIENFEIFEYLGEKPLYEEFPGGITPYMLDVVWMLMQSPATSNLLKKHGANELMSQAH